MPPTKPYAETRLTTFLQRRVLELRSTKSQAEIANETGFINPNMLSIIKSGGTRLPLDRVPALAEALDVDPARLLLLEQWMGSGPTRAFEAIFKVTVTSNEADWIQEIRDASGNSDPAVTTRTRSAIRALFGK